MTGRHVPRKSYKQHVHESPVCELNANLLGGFPLAGEAFSFCFSSDSPPDSPVCRFPLSFLVYKTYYCFKLVILTSESPMASRKIFGVRWRVEQSIARKSENAKLKVSMEDHQRQVAEFSLAKKKKKIEKKGLLRAFKTGVSG